MRGKENFIILHVLAVIMLEKAITSKKKNPHSKKLLKWRRYKLLSDYTVYLRVH